MLEVIVENFLARRPIEVPGASGKASKKKAHRKRLGYRLVMAPLKWVKRSLRCRLGWSCPIKLQVRAPYGTCYSSSGTSSTYNSVIL